ncbi:unnamed protein product [Adineta steineri]|uniref:Uncharacterized protein n=1 Tax=Adineta steineri TaxID=433720 RepID=A0A818K394_9BILA|nr:unnamed protein product [Adineta steineri]
MLFKSSVYLLIYSSVLFSIDKVTNSFSNRFKRGLSDYEPECIEQNTPVDQPQYSTNNSAGTRKKRFVLFPEFVNYKDNWNYLQKPKEISYWISNFYPNRIDTNYIHYCIEHIIQEINTILDDEIILHRASNPGEGTFHFLFFDYTKCPKDDVPAATIDNVTVYHELDIYPAEIARKNRYRAHGGIRLVDNNQPISTIKFNMQQTFLSTSDLVYDPVIYSCGDNETKNECELDTYYVLLHETLHGFGIEHTTNAEQPTPPNPHIQSVMHFSPIRFLCHDDIRALRMIYSLPVTRNNAKHDDTCRRDFPMNPLQKFMYKFGRILFYSIILCAIISTVTCILTLAYILIRHFCPYSKSKKY